MPNDRRDGWVPFHGKPFGGPGHFGLRVTINDRCVVYLNRKAWEALGKPEAVEFLFNDTAEAIGIRHANAQLESAFPVKPKVIQGATHGYIIHAGAFLPDRKIRPRETIQFNNITIDRHGLMSLPLNSITGIGRGAR